MYGAIIFLGGLALLVIGAELVVRGGGSLAASLGVKPLLLGLTVVAVGTSVPELAVGITACLQGTGAIAVGNIAGTNMINILFILGLSAAIRPLPLHGQVLKLELPMMVVAAAMMTLFALDGGLSRLDGLLLLTLALGYTVLLVRASKGEIAVPPQQLEDVFDVEIKVRRKNLVRQRARFALILVAGIVLSVIGADWAVSGAMQIAKLWGMSDAMIGLTIVAIGTSAPELATTVVATIKDERDIAIGNLLGSSIYNILVILGLTCLASPADIPVESKLLLFDIPLMAGVALLCIPVFITGKQVSRFEGGLFVVMYATYMGFMVAWHRGP